MKKIATLLFAMLCSSAYAAEEESTYEQLLQGKECAARSGGDQDFYCFYTIGESLQVYINAIGQPEAGVIFAKSDSDSDFFAMFHMESRCVIVVPGKANDGYRSKLGSAWISPKTGKVYKELLECKYSH